MICTLKGSEARLITRAEIICEIEKACFDEPWTPETVIYQLSQESTVSLIVSENGVPAGCALGTQISGEAELYRLAVLPEHRRKGLGKAALEEFLRECERRGAARVLLEVRSRNVPAVSLYEKAGFSRLAVRKGYYGDDDAIIMELWINSENN